MTVCICIYGLILILLIENTFEATKLLCMQLVILTGYHEMDTQFQ